MSLSRPAFGLNTTACVLATITSILLFGTGCTPTAPVVAEQPVPKVTVTPVVQQDTIDYDEYIGQTEASESVEVRARIFGYLKSIEFKDGDFVKEGQLLFTIEPDEYKAIHEQSVARIALNAANLELAQAKRARNEDLVKTGAVSREEYEESIAAVKSADATITSAKADANRTAVDLKYTEVKAPIDGRIDRAMMTKGSLLTGGQGSGTLLTKIVKERPMYVYFDVDERSLLRYMRLRKGNLDTAPGSLREAGIECKVQLADEKEFAHQGKLDFVATEVNPSTGTARLRGVFANEDGALASGLFVRVQIPVSKPYAALLIPERALATDQSIKFVYVVGDDATATRRSVVLGTQRGDMRIVTSGLEAGERVIVKGLQRVRPGQKVEAELDQLPAAKTAEDKPDTKASPPEAKEPPPEAKEPPPEAKEPPPEAKEPPPEAKASPPEAKQQPAPQERKSDG